VRPQRLVLDLRHKPQRDVFDVQQAHWR
jgi:hypothetical protein